jgi:hypothetical protein
MDERTTNIELRMTGRERALFERSVEKSATYLEFGCGGSTEIAVALGCRAVVSVEADRTWIDALRQKPTIQEAIARRQLFLEYVDIGPVGSWSFPKDDSKIRNWPTYFLTPFVKYDFSYDLILVDGRFRNACAYASYAFMADDAVLAIHDYTTRSSYFDIEKFFELQELADTLAIFKKKEKIHLRSLYTSILSNFFSPL